MRKRLGKRWCGSLEGKGGAHCAPLRRRDTDCRASDIGHWFAMTGGKERIATATSWLRNDKNEVFSVNIKLVYNQNYHYK